MEKKNMDKAVTFTSITGEQGIFGFYGLYDELHNGKHGGEALHLYRFGRSACGTSGHCGRVPQEVYGQGTEEPDYTGRDKFLILY